MTPSSWKQSAATGVVVRKRSRVFTVRQSDSKERSNWRCTGISQLSSLQRDSAVTCGEGRGLEDRLSLGQTGSAEASLEESTKRENLKALETGKPWGGAAAQRAMVGQGAGTVGFVLGPVPRVYTHYLV